MLSKKSDHITENHGTKDALSKLDFRMNQIIKKSLEKHGEKLEKPEEINVFKQANLYQRIRETRFDYFEKMSKIQQRGRKLEFENVYEATSRLSEMKLSTMQQPGLKSASANHSRVSCVASDLEGRLLAIGTKDGELIISSTRNSNLFREAISREKGGKGKNMRRVKSGEVDFITAMHFWTDPFDILLYNTSISEQEKEIYNFYHEYVESEKNSEDRKNR